MKFNLNKSIQILERTPKVLNAYLKDLDKDWVYNNEGENTWSPFDIVGHLVHGEKTDWITRTKILLKNNPKLKFDSFDRFAQIETSKGKSLTELLEEFEQLRKENIKTLKAFKISENEFEYKAIHSELGVVNLKQLLATWTVHDLGHIAQISRVMAKQYKNEVGAWFAYIGVLK
jgi:hypothetical protein